MTLPIPMAELVPQPKFKMRHIPAPEQRALLVPPGSGKTEAALVFIGRYLENNPENRVYFFVPDHALSGELLARARRLIPEANPRVYRGQRDTNFGDPLCHPDMHGQVDLVHELGASVVDMVCKKCPFREDCGWLAQTADKGPGLVILPHSYLTLPQGGSCDLAFIDEEFVTGLEDFARVRVERFKPDYNIEFPTIWEREWFPGAFRLGEDRQALNEAQEKLWKATECGTFVPTLPSLRRAGLTPELCKRAMGIEYDRYRGVTIQLEREIEQGGTPDEIKARLAGVRATFGDAKKKAKIWKSLGAQLRIKEGAREKLNGFALYPVSNQNGGEDWVFSAGLRKRLRVEDKPVYALDATGDMKMLGLALPHLSQLKVLHFETPNMRIVQAVDRKNGKTALVDEPGKDNSRRKARREKLVQIAATLTQVGSVGFVSYKGVTDSPEFAQGVLPEGIADPLYFGKLRGQNKLENVDMLVVVGRNLPDARDVTRIAGALFYDQPEAVTAASMGKGWGTRLMRGADGQLKYEDATDVEIHLDPVSERVRFQITEGELVQAIGRARGVRRDAVKPVTILVLTSTPIPNVPVGEAIAFDDIVPTKLDLNFARTGWDLDNAYHTFRAFPGLFNALGAARDAYRRGGKRVSSISSIYRGNTPTFEVEYRLEGAGQRLATGRYDPRRVRDPHAELERALGPLSYFKIKNSPDTNSHQPSSAETGPRADNTGETK
ncbi:hypothetical protein [Phyllobacterium zundukense]|uniref:Helicase/UvrB N-terminal domain-containing protein n=1 Tax=Phyllobacterium zundukense TaxID=1867719 RepID=A0A2N9W056_9HYPH|nr:hypothetical protein [Phyllobacterium zundukense]ATU90635.1 hypothetical protein BLM14_02405 [Phyllobacterium zundukense]PIO45124.1 hypothetical protein B5P45_08755 [Phyllobacterium zundukense]